MKNTKLLIFKMEDNMIKCNIYLIRVLEDENKENEVEVLFENNWWKFSRNDRRHESSDSGITINHKDN